MIAPRSMLEGENTYIITSELANQRDFKASNHIFNQLVAN